MPTAQTAQTAQPSQLSQKFQNHKIAQGQILVYRMFDVAEEIQLSIAEPLLRNHRGPGRFKVPKFIDRALIVKNPPVGFDLGEVTFTINDRMVKCDVLAKIRDFGVVSLIFQIQIEPGTSWATLVETAAGLEEGTEVDEEAKKLLPHVLNQIGPALVKPTDSDLFEDYIVYYVEKFTEQITIPEVLTEIDIPSLLLAEHEEPLSEGTRKNATENIFQYSTNDLTVIEWNSALVIDPTGGREIPDILEFAVSHLLEMRYYDDLLDARLKDLYDKIEFQKQRFYGGGRFDRIYQESSTRFIEFTEFIERVENSLKVVGDFYLATVYRSATRKFRISDWQEDVTRKINILGQVSNLLQGEVNSRRSHRLEIIIAVLILYEILAAVWLR